MKVLIVMLTLLISSAGFAKCKNECDPKNFRYCDSSAGRYVTKDGYFSTCYCRKTAVMDLKVLQGCCLWQGGVLKTTPTGVVVCNNGVVSESCSLQQPQNNGFNWY